jgi:hypothetical protein
MKHKQSNIKQTKQNIQAEKKIVFQALEAVSSVERDR